MIRKIPSFTAQFACYSILGMALASSAAWVSAPAYSATEKAEKKAKITAIDFKGIGDPNIISIQADGPVQPEKQVNEKDHQIVLTIPGATLAKGVGRKIDTSSFNGNVALISPYQTGGANPSVRVVIQLRDAADVNMEVEGGLVKLSLPGKAALDAPPVAAEKSAKAPASDSAPHSAAAVAEKGIDLNTQSEAKAPVDDVDLVGKGGDSAAAAASVEEKPKDDLQSFLDNRTSRKFAGKPITLQLRDVDVADIFNLISDASGFNIILGSDVKGKMTLSLVGVPWDQALDVVLQTLQLGADRHGNVLRVMTLEGLAKERQAEVNAKRAQENVTPRITRVFPISFADLATLRTQLFALVPQNTRRSTNSTTANNGTSGNGAQSGSGEVTSSMITVVTDERTNSLIVRTLPDVMERVRKLIEIMDTQTPQVLIEGKVVEATENFTRDISGNLGIATVNGPSAFAGFNGGNVTANSLLSSTTTTTTGSTPAVSIGYSIVPNYFRLNASLNIAESESKIKVIAAPKTVVLNKQTANIVQGTPVLVPSSGIGPNGAVVSTSTVQSANLSLDVNPTVTGDGSVLMKLSLSRDVPIKVDATQSGVGTRNIKTNVLVDSGSTLVIGGFFTSRNEHTESGLPFLRKIPILGWLFGSNSNSTDQSELFFFITPQVMNAKKAGIGGTGSG